MTLLCAYTSTVIPIRADYQTAKASFPDFGAGEAVDEVPGERVFPSGGLMVCAEERLCHSVVRGGAWPWGTAPPAVQGAIGGQAGELAEKPPVVLRGPRRGWSALCSPQCQGINCCNVHEVLWRGKQGCKS